MLARDQKSGRPVAIKTLLPECAVSDKAMRCFLREIDVAAELKHSNIVEFVDRGTHNGVVYLVTEFVEGGDAAKLADARGGQLSCSETVSIVSQALDALSFAHSLGFIHRTLKPRTSWSAAPGGNSPPSLRILAWPRVSSSQE